MTPADRKPLPADLLARIATTGSAALLAGCTAEEVIALCRRTVADWMATEVGRQWVDHAARGT